MLIMTDIVKELKAGATISDVLRSQQSYHEHRRWATDKLFDGRKLSKNVAQVDRAALWHSSRAELTTQPAGIRLAVDGVRLANELRETNPLGSDVLHVAAAWSARYWLEEEAHHEVAFGRLLDMAGMDAIDVDDVIEHRGPSRPTTTPGCASSRPASRSRPASPTAGSPGRARTRWSATSSRRS
ncbi:hypothetical protein GXW82_32285 [Streptacidiphilus sp. 4-A2]|nr:hypothetical protein [Streptacidiphilus sp. 4-A2]